MILTFSATLPSLGQNAKRNRASAVIADFVQFERVSASFHGNGVSIKWQMASETGNLGFYVYRNGELVNQLMIPGGATTSQKTVTLREYDTFDAAGTPDSTYVIASHALDGRVSNSTVINVARTGRGGAPLDPVLVPVDNGRVSADKPSLSPELQDIIEANQLAPDLATHRWVVSQPGAKIGVRKDGFYRVSFFELQNAGFNINSPSANWRLFMEGNEQAIIVENGGQYIEFYGRGIDTVESDTRVYYLITDAVEGKRIQNKILRPIGGTAVSNNYRLTTETKERTNYNGFIKNGDLENYFGRLVTEVEPTTSQMISFTLNSIDYSVANSVLNVRLQGLLGGGTHIVRAVLNGHEIGTVNGIGSVSYAGDLAVPTNFLIEGVNQLALNETVSGAASYFDSYRITYNRGYRAEPLNASIPALGNRLSYPTPGYRRVNLTGFATAGVRVFDMSYDGTPALISGLPVVADGATFKVQIPSARPMLMHAIDESALLSSPSITANNPSAYSTQTTPAQMVIISHSAPDFMAAAEDWATYRRSSAGGSFSVKVIDVADIFDEYNYGVLSANSINAFLNDREEVWLTSYVLLIGDSSYDSRNYEGFGYFNQVPTKILNLIYDESGSDDVLADFDGDGLSEMAVGRISARSGFSVGVALDKTKTFETRSGQQLDRGGVFAYDMPNGYDFEAMSQVLRAELPASMPTTFVGRGMPAPNQNTADPTAQTNLINAMNTGPYLVNYAGHGSSGTWATVSYFGNANVPQLTNATSPSLFVMLTCLNGYFIRPRDTDACLAERLVRSQAGGAAASWASTTETTPDFQTVMGSRFFDQITAGNIVRIGDLIRDAKTTLPGNSDLRYSWVLLGDPAMKIIFVDQ